jgi:hypothetical protein
MVFTGTDGDRAYLALRLFWKSGYSGDSGISGYSGISGLRDKR